MTHRRSVVAALAGCLAALFFATACTGAAAAASVTVVAPSERRAAPTVSGALLDGSPYDVGTLAGTVVVLNFWGSWCAPCLAEAPNLEQVYRDTKASGVAFVGIDVKDEAASAVSMQRVHGVTYPSLFDPSQSIAVRFRDLPPTAVPSTIVIDRVGRVAARFLGAIQVSQLEPVVRQIAAESAPPARR